MAYSDASPFLECQAILATQEHDTDELAIVLGKLPPNELPNLESAAATLETACAQMCTHGHLRAVR